MKLEIIIPNYNGGRFLPICLDSLREQTYTDFCITVVDNGSSDDSLSLLSRRYPEVSLIRLSRNRGFAAAANEGILHTESPYVMLLNNDTALDPDCIRRLMKSISGKADVFSAGANILHMKNPRKADTSGDFYTIYGYAFCRDQGLPFRKRKAGQVFTCCGCAVVYRRALLKKTGLFSSDYFAYLEDVDLGLRARRLGYKNILSPGALVYHYGSATTGNRYTPFKVYYSARNNILLRRENLTFFQRVLHAPFVLCGTVLKYLYFCRRGLQQHYLKGCLEGSKTSGARSLDNMAYPVRPFKSWIRTEPWILYGTFLHILQYLCRRLTS